jgi:LPS-assembly protein
VPPYDRAPQLYTRYARPTWTTGWWPRWRPTHLRFESVRELTFAAECAALVPAGADRAPWQAPGWFVTPRAQVHSATYAFDAPLANGERTAAARCRPSAWTAAWSSSARPATSAALHVQTLEPRAFYVYTPFRDQSAPARTTTRATTTSTSPPSTPRTLRRLRPHLRQQPADAGRHHAPVRARQRRRAGPLRRRPAAALQGPAGHAAGRGAGQRAPVGRAVRRDSSTGRPSGRSTRRCSTTPSSRSSRSRWAGATTRATTAWSARPTACSAASASRSTSAGSGRSTTCGATRARTWARHGQGPKAAGIRVGRLNWSLKDKRLVDTLVGVEYDACCWIGRVVLERLQQHGQQRRHAHPVPARVRGLQPARFQRAARRCARISRATSSCATPTWLRPSRFSNYD